MGQSRDGDQQAKWRATHLHRPKRSQPVRQATTLRRPVGRRADRTPQQSQVLRRIRRHLWILPDFGKVTTKR